MVTTNRKTLRRPGNGGKPGVNGSSGFVALSLLMSPAQATKPKPEDGPPCHLCTARCCKYFALPIDRPTTLTEYDEIRWYLMHEGVAVWVDEGDWYLEVRTVCKHLQPDNSCEIYETRPQVCRDYGMPEDEPCEFFTDHLEHELYWDSDDQFEVWIEEQKEKRNRRNARQRERRRLKADLART